MQAEVLHRLCKNRWHGILSTIGVPEAYLTGKHGPCLFCRGRDRWRFDNKCGAGTYFCNQCGSGDGLRLAQKHLGKNFPETLEIISKIVGGCTVETRPDQNIEQKKANLNKLWQSSSDLTGSDPVSKYFLSRKLTLRPGHVRYCPKCYEKNTKKEYPALIAKILNFDGKPVGLQRIYLSEDVESKKKLMPNIESLNGSAVRLFEPSNRLFDPEIIGVAEGICTAMAAAQMHGVAVWSCTSNVLMESWLPPENIRHVVIFSDADANYSGQKSAFILANKLFLRGLVVDVEVPEKLGTDFCDVLEGEK